MLILILGMLIFIPINPILAQDARPPPILHVITPSAPGYAQHNKPLDPLRYRQLTPLQESQFTGVEGTVELGGDCLTHDELVQKIKKDEWELPQVKSKLCKGSHLLECVPSKPIVTQVGEGQEDQEESVSVQTPPSRCNCSVASGGVNFGVPNKEIGCRVPAGKDIWSACNSTQNILFVPLTKEKYVAKCTKQSICDRSLAFPLWRCICHSGVPTNPDGSCDGNNLQMMTVIFYIGIIIGILQFQ